MTLSLDSPIREIHPGVSIRRVGRREKGPPAHEVLAEIGIVTVRDLIHHYPRRYIDRSQVEPIRNLRIGQEATVIATISAVVQKRSHRNKDMVILKLYDGTGYITVTFFNQPWTFKTYKKGQELAVGGVVGRFGGNLQMQKFEVDLLKGEDTINTGRIIPVHRATEGIYVRTIRELVFFALQKLPAIEEPLPADVVDQEHLPAHDWAIRRIHFPDSPEEQARAEERLKFDELFTLELGVAFRKHRVTVAEAGVAHDPDTELLGRFLETLPFEPTAAQRRAVAEVAEAMAGPHPMNRLLQGDVGSGKTVVALAAAMVAIGSGHQAAIMAPTEVLAAQHEKKTAELLAPLGARSYLQAPDRSDGQGSLLGGDEKPALTYALLTAAVTGKDRARILDASARGDVDLLIGTHALVQEGVAFKDLSLAVIDEQHRFGVHQRMTLKEKGTSPDVLIMTATPIPRTLALTYYGDLDVSVLDEMPQGRLPIVTRIARTELERSKAYEVVREEVSAGRQAFVVCAAIDEENRLQVKAAEKEAERLATEVFPDLTVVALHGRMRPAEKQARMDAFRAGESHLLISTTVIEVGVDIPNATVMLIENAERFGLAQLHQLRGRIGRGSFSSYCILFDESSPDNEEARARLAALVKTTDGFELADEDLALRGEGTLFDIKQSGMPDLKLARLAHDVQLVKRARARAFAVIEQDPELAAHPGLKQEMQERFRDSIEWLFQS